MAHQVLARKYRSTTFDDVVGQAPIATTLKNAIAAGRIHHGYLFTGTRGVGKTSMARILAKALNCLSADGPTAEPCLTCDACTAIATGQDIDVAEIDAASNTGVDNIRELRSNTAYRPARARFKIYIIDEVHMLSTGAFNALLKTLEEPPEHVKFILATTELQKVPATIQSRCQRFVFRNIGPDDIAARLVHICKQEQAHADEAVLRRIARLANGSMRDGLSILDQLLSMSDGNLTAEQLADLLPPALDDETLAIVQRAAESDARGALVKLEAILSQGRALDLWCADMVEMLRTLMLLRACDGANDMVDLPPDRRDDYLQLSAAFELSQYVQAIALFDELRRNVRFSGSARALADAALVRFAHLKQWAAIEQVIAQLDDDANRGAEEKKKPLDSDPQPRASRFEPQQPANNARAPASRSKPNHSQPPAPPASPAGATVSADHAARVADAADEPRSGPTATTAHPAPMRQSAPAPTRDAADTRVPQHSNGRAGQRAVEPSHAQAPGDEDPARPTRPGGGGGLTLEEQKQIRDDPFVRGFIQTFDGLLVDVRRAQEVVIDRELDDDEDRDAADATTAPEDHAA